MARFLRVVPLAIALAACAGSDGAQGPVGAAGPTGPAGATGPTGPTGPVATSTVSGKARLLGAGAVAGTSVQLVGTSLGAITDDGGAFEVASVPAGIYPLHLANGAWEETVPNVVALPGGHGFLVDGSIYPLDTIELQRARRVAWAAGDLDLLATSLDSRYAAACEHVGDAYRLLLIDITTGERTELAASCYGRMLFTPDSQAIVIEGNGITLTPTAGGAPVALGGGVVMAVSPDGWKIAVTTPGVPGSSLEVISLADRTSHVVAADALLQWCGFSPDGAAVAYATYENGLIPLWIVPSTGGTALRLAGDISSASYTRFTPDGAAIVFGTTAGEIRTVPVAGGDAALVAGEGAGCFALAPDGARVVYVAWSATLSSVPTGGGAPVLLDSNVSSPCPPQFLPGGARVAYASTTDWTARVADVTGASPPVALPTAGSLAVNGAGTHAAYYRRSDGALELARLSDGQVAWTVPSTAGAAAFSPDGATIARCGGTLDAIAVTSGASTPLLRQGYSEYYCPGVFRWTANGTLLGAVARPAPPDGYRAGLYVAHLP